jgi:hypothetical protein
MTVRRDAMFAGMADEVAHEKRHKDTSTTFLSMAMHSSNT